MARILVFVVLCVSAIAGAASESCCVLTADFNYCYTLTVSPGCLSGYFQVYFVCATVYDDYVDSCTSISGDPGASSDPVRVSLSCHVAALTRCPWLCTARDKITSRLDLGWSRL